MMSKLAALFVLRLAVTLPVRCAEEKELKDSDGKTIIRYVAEVPEGLAPAGTPDPAKQVGLFLCFPEHDRPTGDELYPVRESLKRQGLLDGYILIAGHPQGQKFGAADHEPIQKLLAWALKTYPINPRRVYMYGKGEGGKISGEMTMAYPKLSAAAISYSWTWWKMPAELTEPLDAMNNAPQFYMVLGLRDLAHHLTNVRDGYSRVKAKGYHVIYREFEDLGARTYHPVSNDDAIAWATRLRNRTLPLSAGEQALLNRSSQAKIAPAEGYFAGLATVGGLQAGAAIQKLLDSPDPGIRAAAAETCARANLGEATMEALGRKTVDPSTKVRRAAIHALAVNANWRSPAAQQALIELATSPDKALAQEDRVGAADGLAYAVRLQIKGAKQDPHVFRALVALLESKDEEVRTMAASTLAPIRDAEFRGDLGRPEKKAPNGGWAAWLDTITAKHLGYVQDYAICKGRQSGLTGTPEDLFCAGGAQFLGRDLTTLKPTVKEPVAGFRNTLKAAEAGYLPAQAAVGMLYAVGRGVEQNVAEAAKWWQKAAEGGHVLAATNLMMVYKGGGGVRADAAQAKRWEQFVAEKTAGSN